ncbi:MAG: LysM peptidoglycan-binding domain-containing protein, partial [Betaproteobacteria bacterium]|nr:LysM peptidoglycan-binding domain-containing protein [Betaproteobacteria bacterium]
PPLPRPTSSEQAGTAPDGTIVVASGQSLVGIAKRHGVTVPQLREWNGLTSDALRVGQRLSVRPPQAGGNGSLGTPGAEGRTVEPALGMPDAEGVITVQPGQSLSAIAAKYKVSTTDLRQWNKLKSDQLKIGQKIRVKAPVRIHTVKAGESLNGIAAKYKVSPKNLMQKNKLTSADVLPVGKELIIP